MDNNEILKEIMNIISEECKKYSFTFKDASKVSNVKCRKPNIKEGKQWLISELRSLYFLDNTMKRETYYSLKGEVRHWSLVPVFNYLMKHGHEEIERRFEEYMNSETIFQYKMPVLAKPVEMVSIDISLKPEGLI